MSALAQDVAPTYPVRLSMAYPERLSRLSTAFRIILVIPVLIFIALLTGGSGWTNWGNNNARGIGAGIGGSIVLAIWATILVRGTIPRWLFDFQVAVQRFTYRAYSFIGLLTDRYPAFEGDWDLQYDVDYPGRVSRWRLVFWKFITALPHFIVLAFLTIASAFVIFISWWIILFTGKFPRGLHAFVVGVIRWGARVTAYVESLTDVYPPYSLDANAGPASRGTVIRSSIAGVLIAAILIIAGIIATVALLVLAFKTKTVDISLSSAASGSIPPASATREFDNVVFTLERVNDSPGLDVLQARPGYRLVEVDFTVEDDRVFRNNANQRGLKEGLVRVKGSSGGVVNALLTTADGVPLPLNVPYGREYEGRAYFEVRTDRLPLREVRFYPGNFGRRHVAWRLR